MKSPGLESRQRTLQFLQEEPLDLLIIGGGIVGAGVARDAAMRGLKTALVEQHDFAFGTSSRSSRLLHGGMRYLAQGRIGLVREASVEKKIIHHIAPHLAEPLPFIFPSYRGNKNWVLWQLKIGVKIYDLLCGGRNLGKSTWLTRDEVREKVPALDRTNLNGAVRYYDGFTNDARLTLDTLRSAASSGARLINYCRFKNATRTDGQTQPLTPALSPSAGERENHPPSQRGLATSGRSVITETTGSGPRLFPLPRGGGEGQGEGEGAEKAEHRTSNIQHPTSNAPLTPLWQCEIEDRLGQGTFTVFARAVVNATGPWADGLPHSRVKLRLTKGIHLVVERSRLPVPETVVMTEGKRILFSIPWGDRTILGTTDTDYDGPPDQVNADAEDIRYLLQIANQFFPSAKLTGPDVISTWAGLRPLLADANGKPSDVSRSHEITHPEPGWWDVAGGKLTTYRLMAEQVVDQIVEALGSTGDSPVPSGDSPLGTGVAHPRSSTSFSGSDASPVPSGQPPPRRSGALARHAGGWLDGTGESPVPPAPSSARSAKHQFRACRTASELLLPADEVRGVSGILPPEFSRRAVEHYVANEWAVHLDDVMVRRTSWHYYFKDASQKAGQVADWMGELLGWSEAERRAELERVISNQYSVSSPQQPTALGSRDQLLNTDY